MSLKYRRIGDGRGGSLVALRFSGSLNPGPGRINALGHDVRLIDGQHVSRRVMGNKNDYRDAKVIGELCSQPQTLYVPINISAEIITSRCSLFFK